MGVSGVPCFVLQGKYAVMGAQSVETLTDAIRQVGEEVVAGELLGLLSGKTVGGPRVEAFAPAGNRAIRSPRLLSSGEPSAKCDPYRSNP